MYKRLLSSDYYHNIHKILLSSEYCNIYYNTYKRVLLFDHCTLSHYNHVWQIPQPNAPFWIRIPFSPGVCVCERESVCICMCMSMCHVPCACALCVCTHMHAQIESMHGVQIEGPHAGS